MGVALLIQAAVTIPFVVPRGPDVPPADWPSYGLTTLAVLPLVWRRRAPVTVLLAVLMAQILYKFTLDGPGQSLPYTSLMALYTVAALSPARRRVPAAVGTFALVPPGVALNSRDAKELLFSLFVFGAAYAFGRLTHTRRAYTAAVEDRAAQLERANRIEAERATARERARIAREMHDILSHAVSVMVVQAEAGPVAVRTAPERAEAAFEAISETGRDAMVQLRRMLGLLREDTETSAEAGDTGTSGTAAASGPPPRRPQPSLTTLPGLVERVASGGLAVDHVTEGRPRPLSLDTEATVYRVVQEALTNVVRHAAARSVRIRLAYGADALEITVTDDGRGPADPTGPAPDAVPGHGLIGIRERAAAHGGTAGTGPGPGGLGFRLTVRLPLPPIHSREEVGS
ncbi:histidine kinase [Streptomyces sp. 35G-GA-8]|uniref:sensor histidine kinase n=1 Tax=Streptomyces sp. 35G-GA-8 TaxID=2939434 RepID=UPI00201EA777|nr:histidine kinase [Streptomyces sp. 35G-GA-8]MCL7381801.1 histidine kinase [Streptomyces sp. 35G-GA-8]